MRCHAYTTPKAGSTTDANEDAYSITEISAKKTMVTLADGASTGIFSRQWSNHLAHGIELSALVSAEHFKAALSNLRTSFQPEINRSSAQRKFLLEGSYATLLAAHLEKTGWLFPRISIRFFSVGDVNLLVFDPRGNKKFSHPYDSAAEFNNAPNLVRSGEKLQERTQLVLRDGAYVADAKDIILFATDALAEMILRSGNAALLIIRKIAGCKTPEDFSALMDDFRKSRTLKNDDATIILLSQELG